MTTPDYDVLIIGGGQAGIPLVWALAQAGKQAALVERKDLGGSCVNFGCTPTKAAIASAKLAHQARRGQEYGLSIPIVEVDFPAVLARARRVAEESRDGLDRGLEGSENPKLWRGHGRLDGRSPEGFQVRVGDQLLTAAQVVLNTGTRSLIPAISGLDTIAFLHAGNWLHRPELPSHLALIGGSYIGLEMGQFYRRMGSQVTILENSPHLLPHEDREVAEALEQLLTAEGITFHTAVTLTGVESAGEITLHGSKAGQPFALRASHLFVATGRHPNTDDLGLETLGVKTTPQGYVEVGPRLETNIDGIWAAGDIRGGPLFTHTSWDDYRILASQLLGDGARTTHRIVPYAVFTDPELGRVGLTEAEANASGRKIKTARFEMRRNGKASEIGETEGFIKVIADAETDRILGASLLCAEAAELVHTLIDLMNADAPYTVMRDAIHIHPTLSEATQSAVALLG